MPQPENVLYLRVQEYLAPVGELYLFNGRVLIKQFPEALEPEVSPSHHALAVLPTAGGTERAFELARRGRIHTDKGNAIAFCLFCLAAEPQTGNYLFQHWRDCTGLSLVYIH